jgi:hypothetical protein
MTANVLKLERAQISTTDSPKSAVAELGLS